MTEGLVAGVDCSTQSTKVVVVDGETGRVVAEGRAGHVVSGEGGARESDPNGWWTALRDSLAATGLAGSVRAIAVAGQQHGLVTLDERSRPLRPAVLWHDTRCAPDTARLVEALGGPDEWASRIGSVPVASFTVPKWAWLRRVSPDIAARTRAIRLPHDYMTERLTGRGVTDRGDASGTGWWSVPAGRYDRSVMDLPGVELDESLLPEVVGPGEAAGRVRGEAASELGLPAGCIVGPGTGDNMGGALGLGLEPGEPVLSLGTSGTVFAVSRRPAADPTGTVAGFADATGLFLPLTCALNCTLAVDQIAEWLGLDREAVAPSDGVVVLPYLGGERTPNLPEAAGAVFGLRHGTVAGSILMAAYEAVLVSLLDGLEGIAVQTGGLRTDGPLTLIGGGARGAAWQSVAGSSLRKVPPPRPRPYSQARNRPKWRVAGGLYVTRPM
jgi:xylulokinase